MSSEREYIAYIEELKNLVIFASCSGQYITSDEEYRYTTLRRELEVYPFYKAHRPKELISCTSLDEFTSEMGRLGTYEERWQHIRKLFKPLIEREDFLANSLEQIKSSRVFSELDLLPPDIHVKAREMAEVYLYLYCIENSLRLFISSVMTDETDFIPPKIQSRINSLKKSGEQSKYLPLRGENDLFFCDFSDLTSIFTHNWKVFGQYFPNQNEHWVKVTMDELYEIRCMVAHNSYIGKNEQDSLIVNYRKLMAQLVISKT